MNPTQSLSSMLHGGQYRSSVWLELHSCCSPNNNPKHSHFLLGCMEVRTGPVSGLSSIPAAHQTTIPNTVTSI
ncbi:hypothetical protein DPMN_181206 [Dreissena polymorpha]|uniref:Uncharacterized protein n=1 Tax=Dreissena polymorpha TaxID=45954 RepID=A0A9D4DE07_DREPO|nr:hypothetical protein DPMN_181206 [Dreissena polymorpha]